MCDSAIIEGNNACIYINKLVEYVVNSLLGLFCERVSDEDNIIHKGGFEIVFSDLVKPLVWRGVRGCLKAQSGLLFENFLATSFVYLCKLLELAELHKELSETFFNHNALVDGVIGF